MSKIVKNILVVKLGALGDVVRTSFFAGAIKARAQAASEEVRLFWYTHESSLALIRFNPHIDSIVTSIKPIAHIDFDEIYSLEDELEILREVRQLRARRVIGAQLDDQNVASYCEQSSEWFDMGLLSKFGKSHADSLKAQNLRTHSEIFSTIFDVPEVAFECFNSPEIERRVSREVRFGCEDAYLIGMNAFAGNRWPAKSLREEELVKLVKRLQTETVQNRAVEIVLIGAGSDCARNVRVLEALGHPANVKIADTDENILDLVALVGELDLLITSDSLCMHLATGQAVPTVSFFAPTSAAEIENLPKSRKVVSTSADYCCYKPNADNSTITADRIHAAVISIVTNVGEREC